MKFRRIEAGCCLQMRVRDESEVSQTPRQWLSGPGIGHAAANLYAGRKRHVPDLRRRTGGRFDVDVGDEIRRSGRRDNLDDAVAEWETFEAVMAVRVGLRVDVHCFQTAVDGAGRNFFAAY